MLHARVFHLRRQCSQITTQSTTHVINPAPHPPPPTPPSQPLHDPPKNIIFVDNLPRTSLTPPPTPPHLNHCMIHRRTSSLLTIYHARHKTCEIMVFRTHKLVIPLGEARVETLVYNPFEGITSMETLFGAANGP